MARRFFVAIFPTKKTNKTSQSGELEALKQEKQYFETRKNFLK